LAFNGTAAVFGVVSSSEITVGVPFRATSGAVQVVTPGGTLSSKAAVRVAVAQPSSHPLRIAAYLGSPEGCGGISSRLANLDIGPAPLCLLIFTQRRHDHGYRIGTDGWPGSSFYGLLGLFTGAALSSNYVLREAHVRR